MNTMPLAKYSSTQTDISTATGDFVMQESTYIEAGSPKVLGLIPILPWPRPPATPGLKEANMDEGIWERRAGREGDTRPATGPAARKKEQDTGQGRRQV